MPDTRSSDTPLVTSSDAPAHDGGSGLARRKQGDPEWCIEAGNVFTAEGLETRIEGRGWVSLEEDVLVTSSGPLVLTNRQAGFWYVDK